MNIFHKIELLELTTSEQSLVDFIKKHSKDIMKMDVKEISEACFISTSTIYRFTEKLSLAGLSELKARIASDIDDYIIEKNPIDYNYPFKQGEDEHHLVIKMKELYQQTINNSANLVDYNLLHQIALLLNEYPFIDFYTSAGNIFFAENFKFQMQEIGRFVNIPLEMYHMKLTASTSTKQHIAMIVSYEGRGFSFLEIIKILKKNKNKIILISSTKDNPLITYANHVLFLNSYENHFNKISSFSTRLSLLYLLDCIYTSYFNLDYDKNIQYKLKAYQLLSTK